MSNRRIKAYTILLFVTLIWAAAGSVIKHTLNEIPPFTFLTYRFAISALIASIFLFSGKVELPKRENLGLIIINALLVNVLGLGLLFWGLNKTTVLDNSVIDASAPIIAAILGYKILSEHITKKEKIGISIAFIGTLYTIVGPLLDSELLSQSMNLDRFIGNLAIFIFIIFDGIALIIGKKLLRLGEKPYTIAHSSFIISAISIIPVAIFFEGGGSIIPTITSLSLAGHIGVLYMAILSGTLAYALWNKAIKSIEVSEASVFRYLIPIFSAPIAILWLNEHPSIHFFIGATIIAVGVFMAEYKGRLNSHNLHHFGHRK